MNRQTTRSNCAMYAFDRVHKDGGYIGFCYSKHWHVQHVAHYDNLSGVLTQFTPQHDLPQPWHSVAGFDGQVVAGDPHYRKPMPVWLMYAGVAYLFAALTVWYILRSLDKWRNDT